MCLEDFCLWKVWRCWCGRTTGLGISCTKHWVLGSRWLVSWKIVWVDRCREGISSGTLHGTLSSEGLGDTDGRNARVPLGNTGDAERMSKWVSTGRYTIVFEWSHFNRLDEIEMKYWYCVGGTGRRDSDDFASERSMERDWTGKIVFGVVAECWLTVTRVAGKC